jgi:hypothetical protein
MRLCLAYQPSHRRLVTPMPGVKPGGSQVCDYHVSPLCLRVRLANAMAYLLSLAQWAKYQPYKCPPLSCPPCAHTAAVSWPHAYVQRCRAARFLVCGPGEPLPVKGGVAWRAYPLNATLPFQGNYPTSSGRCLHGLRLVVHSGCLSRCPHRPRFLAALLTKSSCPFNDSEYRRWYSVWHDRHLRWT